jgi:hypothetical protein
MQKRSTHNGFIGKRYVDNCEDLLERDILREAPIMTRISKMLLTGIPEPSISMRGVDCTPIIYQYLMYRGATQDEVDIR